MNAYTYQSLAPGHLANGRPLGFGDKVELSDDDLACPHNARLIEERLLVAAALPARNSQTNGAEVKATLRRVSKPSMKSQLNTKE